MGASRDQSATWSIRSTSVGSAQWMSSNTATTGRVPASVSRSFRKAQAVSSAGAADSAKPIAWTSRCAATVPSRPGRIAATFAATTSGWSSSVMPAA